MQLTDLKTKIRLSLEFQKLKKLGTPEQHSILGQGICTTLCQGVDDVSPWKPPCTGAGVLLDVPCECERVGVCMRLSSTSFA